MQEIDQVGFSCDACGKQYRWKSELAGKRVKCKCGAVVRVPAQDPAAVIAHVSPPPAPVRTHASSTDEEDGDGFDALAALAQQEAAAADEATASADLNFCANCRSRMSPQAILCTSCGYDRRKGNVVAAAKVKDPNARRMFGLRAPAKDKPTKVVDKMAPQGSFVVGVLVSIGLALAASLVWILVAWGVGWDIYFLVALVGIGAGVGMQIGQKGYSTIGGLAVVCVTLGVMILARVVVIVAIVLPILRAGDVEAESVASAGDERVEIQTNTFGVLKDRPYNDRDNNAPVGPPQDPRVISRLSEDVYKERGIAPAFANEDQHNAVELEANIRATTMPAEKKNVLIAEMDKRAEKDRLVSMLVGEYMDKVQRLGGGGKVLYGPTVDLMRGKVEKMTLDEQKKEMVRVEADQKTLRASDEKEYAAAEAEEKKQAEIAALADGLDAPAPEAATVANAGFDEPDADMDADHSDEPGASAKGAKLTNVSASANHSAGALAEADDADGPGVAVGFGAILLLVFFGGIKSFVFMIGALLLAYRTAAGATWG